MSRSNERGLTLPPAEQAGSTTLEIRRSIGIAADLQRVFDYVTDFNRAHEWRGEVVESTMSPTGPMRAGSRLREVAVVAGRRLVTDSVVAKFEPPDRFTFEHVSGPLPVSGEYRFEPSLGENGPTGATVHYTLRVQLGGAWRLLAPLLRLTAPRTMARSLQQLANHLAPAGR